MTEKLHIENILNDEWALDLIDRIEVLRYKIHTVNLEGEGIGLGLGLELGDFEDRVKLEEEIRIQRNKLIDSFFDKYYVEEQLDPKGNINSEYSFMFSLEGKTKTIQKLLAKAAERSSKNIKQPKLSIEITQKLGSMYIDRTEEGNIGKKHIELIFQSESDTKILEQMEEVLEKETLSLWEVASRELGSTGKPLPKKDYSKEFFNLIKKVEEKYYIDEDIDYWGRVSKAWYTFETLDEFYKTVIKEQKIRGERKRLPKKMAEKITALQLIIKEQ